MMACRSPAFGCGRFRPRRFITCCAIDFERRLDQFGSGHATDAMTEPLQVARQYLQAWNEKDPGRRRRLLADTSAEDAAYIDPLAQCAGLKEIDEMIATAQARLPEFRFSLCGGAEGYGNHVGFSWAIEREVGSGPIKGTDGVVLEAGWAKSIIGFLDALPVAA
jgi:SnoaL-like domain